MSKFKIGDKLRCKPGFTTRDEGEDRGGAGYSENKEIVVNRISNYTDESIYWVAENSSGIYERALELSEPINEIILW